jgi:AFG3 family protein
MPLLFAVLRGGVAPARLRCVIHTRSADKSKSIRLSHGVVYGCHYAFASRSMAVSPYSTTPTTSTTMIRSATAAFNFIMPHDRYCGGTSTFQNTRRTFFWLAANKQLPKGFEDWFPENAKRQPPTAEELESANKKHNDDTDGNISDDTHTTPDEDASKTAFQDDNEKNGKHKTKQGEQPPPPPPPNNSTFSFPSALLMLGLVLFLHSLLDNQEENRGGQEITFQEFASKFLAKGEVARLDVINNRVARVTLKEKRAPTNIQEVHHYGSGGSGGDGSESTTTTSTTTTPTYYYFYIGSEELLTEKLSRAQAHVHPSHRVEPEYHSESQALNKDLLELVPSFIIGLAIFAALRTLMPPAGAGGRGAAGGGIFSVGKSTAKKIAKEDINVDFSDVAGCDQAKMEIMEFVDFLKDADRFTKLGAKIPKGALLCGPPGTGKTLLAKAVAGQAGVPFYSISGSDFIEMFVGVGPSRVRDLFKEARKNAPCIIFIDEIDAVGRQRGRGGFSGGNDERENTLNQLLVEMDGFSPSAGVVVLGGTNRVDILDQALTRPGRFDRQIQVDLPDLKGRKDIFAVHLKGITLEGPVEEFAGRLAGLTPGFAGADIANICNEAAIMAARRKGESVNMVDFEKATDRIIGGLESNKIMSAEERSIVAHHEAGHAIGGWFLEHADPLLKVTIIPRASGALGFAQYLPKETHLRSQEQIMDIVCMALAGRASEEVFFGKVTTGASDDLRRVTQLVYGMIKDYGMNAKLGQLAFPQEQNEYGMSGEQLYSDSTAEAMDDEARAIVDAAYLKTVELIRQHKEDVSKIAQLLLTKETITHDDIIDTVGPRPFVGDSAYNEFVSHREYARGKQERKDAKDKEDEEKEAEDIGPLSPGLA